jgi:hypothetical protein
VSAKGFLGAVALAVLGAMLAAPASAQRLGRLFTTQEERQVLEEARREYEYGAPAPESPSVPQPQQTESVVSKLTINGVVLRSSGVNSTWVNGSPVLGGVTREGLRVEADRHSGGNVRITLPSGVGTVQLRAGQKIDVGSGSVQEGYQRDTTEDAASAFELAPDAQAPRASDTAEQAAGQRTPAPPAPAAGS